MHASAVSTTRTIITLIVLIMSLLPIGIVIAEYTSYSGYEYMWFEPGHYLHYTEIYDTEVKDLEVVYQETVTDGIFMTFNFLDRKYHDSSLLGGSHGDKIILRSGFPSKNEFNLWFLITLPKSFDDGDMWKHNDVGCRVDYIGDWVVKGKSFSDVIKISINSLNSYEEYTRGEGEVYLAKGIGIIDWEFRKVNGEVFNIEIEDWGELPPRIISGRLTLDGNYPATGYHIGLSNRHENDATSKITDEMGRFSFIAYGHKLTLRYAPILSGGGLDWDEHTEYKLIDIDSDITDLVLSLGYPPIPVEINIDCISFEKERVDVGTTQIVSLHFSWAFDGTDATNIEVKIFNSKISYNWYFTNQTGWINFPLEEYTVGSKSYEVTYVSDCDDFNVEIDLISPIWDKVTIQSDQTIRIQSGAILPSTIAYYEYDETPYIGAFILNDTITNKAVGKYNFRIMGIADEKYGLTQYSPDMVNVIIDEITFNIILTDQRLDLGQEPEIAASGTYEYDGEHFTGGITFTEPADINSVSEHTYRVADIEDNKYGFTSFVTNGIICIWDRLKITSSGVSDSTTLPGETETVWFKAIYEYDAEVFDSSAGSLMINVQEADWNEDEERWEIQVTHKNEITETFEVTSYIDKLYGLSGINHEASTQTIKWARSLWDKIPGFPYESIIIGLIAVIIIIWRTRKS